MKSWKTQTPRNAPFASMEIAPSLKLKQNSLNPFRSWYRLAMCMRVSVILHHRGLLTKKGVDDCCRGWRPEAFDILPTLRFKSFLLMLAQTGAEIKMSASEKSSAQNTLDGVVILERSSNGGKDLN